MCYNCGCGVKDNNQGSSDNITSEDFEKASKAAGQTVQESKEHAYEALKQELGK